MAEPYFDLPRDHAIRVLRDAAGRTGRHGALLEKDIWNVWCLETLFGELVGDESFGDFLVFKGGTSLSKAYGLIQRYSEDVDIACDIRHFFPELEISGYDYLPGTTRQGTRLARRARKYQERWLESEVEPLLKARLQAVDPKGRIERKGNILFVHYTPLTEPVGYVNHAVKLEFYPRSTGEPCQSMPIACDVAGLVSGVEFPAISLRVLAAERTFWEKASVMHVRSRKKDTGEKGFARHLYDLMCLADAGVADRAIDDRNLAVAIAEHNDKFRKEKYGENNEHVVDYHETYNGNLQLIPDDAVALEQLRLDYHKMIEASMFVGDPPPFSVVVDKCRKLERRVNDRAERG